MKLASWNVNGIRAGIRKGTFFDYLEKKSPDIAGLQEVKGSLEQLDNDSVEKIKSLGYEIYWNAAMRPGYSGTALLTKITPINVYNGINIAGLHLNSEEIDKVIEDNHEGRVITAEYEDFYYITVYTPNSKSDLSRLEYREVWDHAFLKYCNFLENKKPVIFCGDLNVAHTEIDLANPGPNKTTDKKPGSAGFTNIERAGMDEILNNGYIDTFRYFYPEKERVYSWWSNFGNARARNTGWRIDYFVSSPKLKDRLIDANILMEVEGSDHCPVELEIK